MKKRVNNFIYIFLLFQPLLDIITSLMTRFLDTKITLGLLVRGSLFVISLIYILFLSKSKYKKKSTIYLIILSIFTIIYFGTKISIFTNMSFIVSEVIYLFKYYYTLIMFLTLLNLFDEFKPNNRKIFKLLQIELFLYCFSIVLANITGTAFGTYAGGFGNTGWFFAGNEIGIIAALLLPFTYLLINKAISFKPLFYIVPIVLGIEIIGTKTSMLGLLMPTTIFCIYYLIRIKNGKAKHFFMTLIILVIIIISSPNLPVVENIKNSISRFDNRLNKEDLDEDYSDTMLSTVLLSDRDYYLKKTVKIYEKASNTDKLFGLGFVNREEINDKNIEKLVEMDFYDVYYHYGIIGFIVYMLPFIYFIIMTIKYCFKLKFKLNYKQLILGYASYVALFISFMCGHVLGAPAVSIYMCIAMVLLLYYLENEYYKIELNDNKITILALHLGIGGIEQYIYSLTKMLKDHYEIEIISTYKVNEKPQFKFDKDIRIKYLINDYPHREEFKQNVKDKNIIKIFISGFNLVKILILKYLRNIQIVEEINSRYIITTRDFHNEIVSHNKNRDIISIATEHNYHNNNKKYIKRLVNSCSNIDYLILVSEELRDFYQPKLKNTKCIYIPNTIDNIPKYIKKKNIKNKLVSIGRLSKEKGFLDLVEIINIVKKDIPNIKLDIYGDGQERAQIEEKIKKYNLTSNIKLLGFYPNDKLLNKLNEYDLYLMTSYTESFGLVLIESMSRSLCCIAFDSANGAKNLLKDNNGILIKERNKEEFAKKIIDLLNNKDELNKITQTGYNYSLRYDIKNVQKQWLDLFGQIK